MELTSISLAKEIADHPNWKWHGMMSCTDITGKQLGLYSYIPADIKILPCLSCSRVTGRMLADIFLVAQEVHYVGGQLRVVMSPRYECIASGTERIASCWLSISRWLVAQEETRNG